VGNDLVHIARCQRIRAATRTRDKRKEARVSFTSDAACARRREGRRLGRANWKRRINHAGQTAESDQRSLRSRCGIGEWQPNTVHQDVVGTDWNWRFKGPDGGQGYSFFERLIEVCRIAIDAINSIAFNSHAPLRDAVFVNRQTARIT
jgi:hypothetical protein